MKSSKLFHHFEIIGMFWKWHLTFLMALSFLAPRVCVLGSCGEDEEDQWPSWPSQRELRMLPLNWSMLGAEEWGNAPCPWGTQVCQSRIHPWTVWPLFLCTWLGEGGGMREEPVPAQPEWEMKKFGKEESPYGACLGFSRLQIIVDYLCCSTAGTSGAFRKQLCLVRSYKVLGGRAERNVLRY